MIQRIVSDEPSRNAPEPESDEDPLGEAVEAYLALVEEGKAPHPDKFAAAYPEIRDDLRAALDGLRMVQGLVGTSVRSGAPSDFLPLAPGRELAGYRIVRELGRGGMGVVYEAVHVGLDRPVALKVLTHQAAPGSLGRRRFLNEARTAASLHHTHIVPVFDVGQTGNVCYYAMQRIEGSGLDRVLRVLRRQDRWVRAHPPRWFGRSPTRTADSKPLPQTKPAPRALTGAEAAPAPPTKSMPAPAPVLDHGNGRGVLANLTTSHPPAPKGSADRKFDLDRDLDLDNERDSLGFLVDPSVVGETEEDWVSPYDPPHGGAYYRWVAGVGVQAAEALAFAHEQGVIHRDVKPSNVLIDGRGQVWVADFGLARRIEDQHLSRTGSLVGTPRYMSPEQMQGLPLDGRTDVFSLGSTLYELLTLRPPFAGQNVAALTKQIIESDPTSPRTWDPSIPRDLETIALKALAKRPADRYRNAGELADDLNRFLNREPVRARRISSLGRFWRFTRRHPGIVGVSAVALVLVIGVTMVAYLRVAGERDLAVQAQRTLRSEMRERMVGDASLVLRSNVPNRREIGLKRLREAAVMESESDNSSGLGGGFAAADPALQARLRNIAVSFLTIRDLLPRPALKLGPVRDLAFLDEHNQMATLSEDTDSVSIWDLEKNLLVDRHRLDQTQIQPPNSPDGPVFSREDRGGRNASPSGARPGGGGGDSRRIRRGTIVSVGKMLLRVGPGGRGLLWMDPVSCEGSHLSLPSREIFYVLASLDGQRLVTIDRDRDRDREPGPRDWDDGASGETERERWIPEFPKIHLWDPNAMDAPLASWDLFEPSFDGGVGRAQFVSLSADGKTLAVWSWMGRDIRVFSGEDGRELATWDAQAPITSVAAGRDGLLAVAAGGAVRIWQGETPLPSLATHQTPARRLRFSGNGMLLAVSGPNPEVEVWDIGTGALAATLPVSGQVQELLFSPLGRTLVALSGETLFRWDVADPVGRYQPRELDAPPRSLSFRDDGLLAVNSNAGSLWFWCPSRCRSALWDWTNAAIANPANPANPKPPTPGPGADAAPKRERNPQIWTGLYPVGEPRPAATNPANRIVTGLFDADGGLWLRDGKSLRLLELNAEDERSWDREPPGAAPSRLVADLPREVRSDFGIPRTVTSPKRDVLAWTVANRDSPTRTGFPNIALWLPQAEPHLRIAQLFLDAADSDVVAASRKPGVRRPEPGEGRPPSAPSPRGGGRGGFLTWTGLAVSSQAKYLYMLNGQGQLVACEREENRLRVLPWSLGPLSSSPLQSLALSWDESVLAAGDQAGAVFLIGTATGELLQTIAPQNTDPEASGIPVSALAFAPDDGILAVGGQENVRLLRAEQADSEERTLAGSLKDRSMDLLVQLPAQRGRVFLLAFSPTGDYLATGGNDPRIEIWNLARVREELVKYDLGW